MIEPLTVGQYLRRRRTAQGLQFDLPDFDISTEAVEAIESDAREPNLAELGELLFYVRLDFMILTAIAAGGQAALEATEETCRVCACASADACQDHRGPCAWSETEDRLCTFCELDGRTVDETGAVTAPKSTSTLQGA